MRVEELQNSLEAFEQRLVERRNAEKASQGVSQALQARNDYKPRGRGRGRGRARGGRAGGRNSSGADQNDEDENSENKNGGKRGGKYSRGRGRSKVDKRNIQCFTCSKFGHYASECWHNEEAMKNKGKEEANLAQEADNSDSDHVLLMSAIDSDKETQQWSLAQENCLNVCKVVACNGGKCQEKKANRTPNEERCQEEDVHVSMAHETRHAEDETCWYLDTACSNHMTGRKEWLLDLDPKIRSNVRFADDSVIMAEGADKILIKRKDGRSAYMNNVLYVPNMKSNLLSLGQLLEKGYTMKMHQKHMEVFDERQQLILKAPLAKNRTFKVKLDVVVVQCLAAIDTKEEAWLWHCRFGHLNFRSQSLLKSKNL
ncbi:uncharacterized protein LOC106758488 [Vigna radiata var. radiata]|uniref:Uncharacterized protein LOC106758488 n=1 Tax=Vigna radiata var. radiata TaxID=3916 RepID=A0A1S3TSX9_VIGRR|nr:uncharacterized protein LOC106758488 [Vigna radiata var. radiata]